MTKMHGKWWWLRCMVSDDDLWLAKIMVSGGELWLPKMMVIVIYDDRDGW